MTTLTEFLTARLDEDEAVARDVIETAVARGVDRERMATVRQRGHFEPQGWGAWQPDDIDAVAFDAARVLAEVEAKRRIVELHDFTQWTLPEDLWPGGLRRACLMCGNYAEGVEIDWPCDTIKAVALPYADHPDYDERWRP